MTEPALQFFENHAREEPGVYSWTFPGAPIRIDIRLEVIRKLRVAAFQTDSNGGPLDIGGVLLGHSGSTRTIEISDYLRIPCERNAIQGYVLNTSVLEAV